MVKTTVSICAGALLLAATSIAGAQTRSMVRPGQPGVVREVVVEVKPAQLAAQRSYEARTDARIRELVHQDKKAVTEEERTLIDEHWRRTERLWRIRHLAENAGDGANVTRCDSLIKRADEVLERQIKMFRDRAPVVTVEVKR